MKSMKKAGLLCMSLALVFILSGCTLNKTAITSEDFSEEARAAGFSVHDVTHQMGGDTVTSLVAIDNARGFQIEFHVVPTQAQASAAFAENRTNLDNIGSGTTVSTNGNNWARFAITSGGAYGFVSYIDNTFIYVRAPQEHRAVIREFVESLGY
ncbi:MAG: hypothetical protein FWC79_02625 [Oscillospiraceae bacterium]|nr:hypothetical protein [Oscillospiraceae bacterium]